MLKNLNLLGKLYHTGKEKLAYGGVPMSHGEIDRGCLSLVRGSPGPKRRNGALPAAGPQGQGRRGLEDRLFILGLIHK